MSTVDGQAAHLNCEWQAHQRSQHLPFICSFTYSVRRLQQIPDEDEWMAWYGGAGRDGHITTWFKFVFDEGPNGNETLRHIVDVRKVSTESSELPTCYRFKLHLIFCVVCRQLSYREAKQVFDHILLGWARVCGGVSVWAWNSMRPLKRKNVRFVWVLWHAIVWHIKLPKSPKWFYSQLGFGWPTYSRWETGKKSLWRPTCQSHHSEVFLHLHFWRATTGRQTIAFRWNYEF